MADLQEVKSMLAERVTEWTRQWKQEGFEKGLEQGLEEGEERSLERLRGILLQEMESRFGAIPESVRRKVSSLGSIEVIASLIAQAATASSVDALAL